MKLPRYFFAFFFVSGFCSLVYEVIWLRLEHGQIRRHDAHGLDCAFGLHGGAGAWVLAGREMDARRGLVAASAPLRLYGLLELLIGVSAFAAPATIDWGYRLLRDTGGGLAWGSSLLLPGVGRMGHAGAAAVVHVHGRYVPVRDGGHPAHERGGVGTFVQLFVSGECAGRDRRHADSGVRADRAIRILRHAAYRERDERAAGGGGVLCEFAASAGGDGKTFTAEAQRTQGFSSSGSILWLLFATGLCSMAMEVIWIREFTVYLGNVVYAFAAILAMYLAATFTGSLIYRRRMKGGDAAWIALGLAALLPLLFADPRLPLPEAQYTLEGFLFGAVRAGLGVILFSGLAGYLTPMLVDRVVGGRSRSRRPCLCRECAWGRFWGRWFRASACCRGPANIGDCAL